MMGRKMTSEIEKVCQGFEALAQEYMRRFKEFEKKISLSTYDTSPIEPGKYELEVL